MGKALLGQDADTEKKVRSVLDRCEWVTHADRCEQAYKRFMCVKDGTDDIIALRKKKKTMI